MKKGSTVRVKGNMIFKGQKLTLGMDLGDHWSCYCGRPAGEFLNLPGQNSRRTRCPTHEPHFKRRFMINQAR